MKVLSPNMYRDECTLRYFFFHFVKKVNKTFHLRLSFAARLSGREGKESIISKSNIWAHGRFVIRCVSRSLRQTKKDSHRRRDYSQHLNLNCCHFPFEWVFMPAFSSLTSFNRLYRSPLWANMACLAVMWRCFLMHSFWSAELSGLAIERVKSFNNPWTSLPNDPNCMP